MDKNGFLAPPGVLKCKRCGKGLNADGNHPAETYAGTATGLCYPCTSEGAYPTGKVMLSGAIQYSHPPSLPSHRRDRETYYGFKECTKCRGKGSTLQSRSFAMGGSYKVQCPECSKKHHADPDVKAYEKVWKEYHEACGEWRRAAVEEYDKRLKKAAKEAGIPLPRGKKKLQEALLEHQDALDPQKKIAKAVLAEIDEKKPTKPEISPYK